jgi:hypothetical protein
VNWPQHFLDAVSDEDKSLFRALIDEGFEVAFNELLAANAGHSIEEQTANFVRVLEDYTFEELDKDDLRSALQKKDTATAGSAAGGSSSAFGGAEAASTTSKTQTTAPAASSPSFVRPGASPAAASPARPQQNENAAEGRTYLKARNNIIVLILSYIFRANITCFDCKSDQCPLFLRTCEPHVQVPYESKDDFKKAMNAKKLAFGWDSAHRAWYAMTTYPDIIAAIVAEGWEVQPNPNEV